MHSKGQMKYKFILDREFYQYQASILEWCRTYVGKGGWNELIVDDSALWMISCQFGYTSVHFRNLEHSNLFATTWNVVEEY